MGSLGYVGHTQSDISNFSFLILVFWGIFFDNNAGPVIWILPSSGQDYMYYHTIAMVKGIIT